MSTLEMPRLSPKLQLNQRQQTERLYRLLLIEDDLEDASLIRDVLAQALHRRFVLEWVSQVSTALERLTRDGIDVVILDLSLPHSPGNETFFQVWQAARFVPILVLSDAEDEARAMEAVDCGAQDYLIKNYLDSDSLACSLRRAIEPQAAEDGKIALHSLHLQSALHRNEFVLHYQPKVNLQTGEITGAEALLRWVHQDRGLVLPDQFVPAAEDCGAIVAITKWALREACAQARAWMDAGLKPVPVSVNISRLDLRTKGFLAEMQAILDEARLQPCYLELELNEKTLLQDGESNFAILHALKALGVQLAIDDFATGYSNLGYLSRLPFDALNISRSFVRNINLNADDAAIVSVLISIGIILKKRVVAEGMESQEQLEFLQLQGCNEGRGYYFSPAVTGEHFAELLKARTRQRKFITPKPLPARWQRSLVAAKPQST